MAGPSRPSTSASPRASWASRPHSRASRASDGDDWLRDSKHPELQGVLAQIEEQNIQSEALKERQKQLECDMSVVRGELHELEGCRDAELTCEALLVGRDDLRRRLAEQEDVLHSETHRHQSMLSDLKDSQRRDHLEVAGKRLREQEDARQCRQLLDQTDAQLQKNLGERQKWAKEKREMEEKCRRLLQQRSQLQRCLKGSPMPEEKVSPSLDESVRILESALPRVLKAMASQLADAVSELLVREGQALAETANLAKIAKRLEVENMGLREQQEVFSQRVKLLERPNADSRADTDAHKQVEDAIADAQEELAFLRSELEVAEGELERAEAEVKRWHSEFVTLTASLE